MIMQSKKRDIYLSMNIKALGSFETSGTTYTMAERLRWSRGAIEACWPLVPNFAGSHPAEAVRFLGQKNSQHAFLRRGSKAVGPMS